MRIISNFKDYYDVMLQHGADETIVFPRINNHLYGEQTMSFESNEWKINHTRNELKNDNLLERLKNGHILDLKEPENKGFSILKSYFRNINEDRQHPRAVLKKIITVVNGKPTSSYVILQHSGNNIQYKMVKKNVSAEDCFNYLKDNIDFITSSYSRNHLAQYKTYKDFLDDNVAKKSSYYYISKSRKQFEVNEKDLLSIHKELNSPIFFIVDDKVLSNIPLVYFGVTKLFDSNVALLYQEISYCLTNVISNKNEPPIAVSNEMKVEQHGFDKKISFRKRI